MKTPAVSAGCLQYKHSQGSQREVGWLWEQSGARRYRATLDSGTGRGKGRVKRRGEKQYGKYGCSLQRRDL